MASKVTGYQGVVLVSDERESDPLLGDLQIQIWRGTKSVIVAKESALITDGWKTSRRKWTGPAYELEATKPTDTPADRWKIVTELFQLDLKTNPYLIKAAADAGSLTDPAAIARAVAKWFTDIDNAIAANKSLADYYAGIPAEVGTIIADALQELYNLRAIGVEAYEVHRPVLSRIRTTTANYGDAFDIDAISAIWTTAALVHDFEIPDNILARLPADPTTTPLNCVWGWKLRQQESDILLSTNRVEETYAWVFAAWPTLLYEVHVYP